MTDDLLSWAEMAQILGIPEADVKKRYTTALKKLKAEMIKDGVSEVEFMQYLHMRENAK